MDFKQLAVAIFNDANTAERRAWALDYFINNGANFHTPAVQSLLICVFTEMRKPIYEGMTFTGSAWECAAEVLDMEIQHAIDCKGE